MIWRGALCASLASAFLSLGQPLAAAPKPEPLQFLPAIAGDYFPIRSAATDWDYHVYVRLPPDYDEHPDRRYPVVYLLDGDSLFPVLGGNHIFLTIDDKLPEAIVVGIAYGGFGSPPNRRHIDFMPPGTKVKDGEARIADFQRFMKDELIPAVEPRYRVDPARRILFGQSRGGAMVLFSAFADPDLFWARIASNPSWTPGEDVFFGRPAPSSRDDLTLVVSTGEHEDQERRAGGERWFAHWEKAKKPWTLHRVEIPGGSHSADAVRAYREALRLIFKR